MIKITKRGLQIAIGTINIIFCFAFYFLQVNILRYFDNTLKVLLQIGTIQIHSAIIVFIVCYYYKLQLNIDSLTGLKSRGKLIEDLKRRINRKKELNLAYIDLDKFKIINDTRGHEAGNEVLNAFGERMKKFPELKTYRIGGDEFAILIDGEKSQEELDEVLEKIIGIKTPIKIGCFEEKLEFSIGLSNYPRDAKTWEKLIDIADKAMYKEKHRVI